MRDYIDLGSAPANEDCAQLGAPDYYEKARAECTRFIQLLRRTFGDEPEGARLAIKSNAHEWGNYYSVVCYFDDEFAGAREYAFRLENDIPAYWDAASFAAPETKEARVCDSCLTAAYDMGVPDRSTAEMLMVDMGGDVEDHLCDQVEAPHATGRCLCACRRRR